jgi:hypothetical protein
VTEKLHPLVEEARREGSARTAAHVEGLVAPDGRLVRPTPDGGVETVDIGATRPAIRPPADSGESGAGHVEAAG